MSECQVCSEISVEESQNNRCPSCNKFICTDCWKGWIQARKDIGYDYICPLTNCRKNITHEFITSLQIVLKEPKQHKPPPSINYWMFSLAKRLGAIDRLFEFFYPHPKSEDLYLCNRAVLGIDGAILSSWILWYISNYKIIVLRNFVPEKIDYATRVTIAYSMILLSLSGGLLFIKNRPFRKIAKNIVNKYFDPETKLFIDQQMEKGNYNNCPRCLVMIEKNEGCNNMRCEQCGHWFRWDLQI